MVLALAGVAAAVAPLSFLASIYFIPMLLPPEVSRCISSCLPGPSNVVPFWVWYGFLVGTLVRTTKKGLHWRV